MRGNVFLYPHLGLVCILDTTDYKMSFICCYFSPNRGEVGNLVASRSANLLILNMSNPDHNFSEIIAALPIPYGTCCVKGVFPFYRVIADYLGVDIQVSC